MSISRAKCTPDKYIFLQEVTAKRHHHGDKSFFQHLSNVCEYLKSQSAPEEVCDAGLFHSIYGTEFFDFEDDAITRDIIRSYIGNYAEELVYTFCRLKKNRFRTIVTNSEGWDAEKFLDLCWIEFANLRDHKENSRNHKKMEILGQVMAYLQNGLQNNGRDD